MQSLRGDFSDNTSSRADFLAMHSPIEGIHAPPGWALPGRPHYSILRRRVAMASEKESCASWRFARSPASLPEGPGRNTEFPLEGPVECRFRFVAGLVGDLRHRLRATAQPVGSHQEPAAAQIAHGWDANAAREPVGERGARQPDLTRQLVQRPGMGRPGMDEREDPSDERVAQPGQPSRLTRPAVS